MRVPKNIFIYPLCTTCQTSAHASTTTQTRSKRVRAQTSGTYFQLFFRGSLGSPKRHIQLRLFPNGHSKFGAIDPVITQAMFATYTADILNAPCAFEDDAKRIVAFIKEGHQGSGVQRLQRRLQRWSAFHQVLVKAGSGDEGIADLKKVISVPGFSIQAEFAKGVLGESALHEAVAANGQKTVKILLAAGVAPNSTDAMQETPLHYAALAGNAPMARLLIDSLADPLHENTFGETPLEVASQDAAAFLGHASAQLVGLLRQKESESLVAHCSPSSLSANCSPSSGMSSTFGV